MISDRIRDLIASLIAIPTDDARREAAARLSDLDRAGIVRAQSVSFFDSERADQIVDAMVAMPLAGRPDAFSRMTPADQDLGWARLARVALL